MHQLLQNIEAEAKTITKDGDSISAFYDKYAPALLGTIMKVVKQQEMAEKILERVLINALVDKKIEKETNLTYFTSLLNHSRKKSYATIKAMRLLQACNCD